MLDRLEYRAELIEKALAEAGFTPKVKAPRVEPTSTGKRWPAAAECCRRCSAAPTLWTTRWSLNCVAARRGEHASNLGAVLALRFAQAAGVNAYIVDPVTADEWQACARLSGSPLVERTYIGHSLNTKAVAKRYARGLGRGYADLRLIVIHMGSGITVSAHREGRMIDSNSIEEGPFGPDRTGSLPVRALIKLSSAMTVQELDRHVFGDGGLFAYLGTRDLIEVERRIDAGDQKAAAVFAAMVYQIAKEAGAMAAVLEGKVDAVLVTGGMAHSERAVARLRGYVEWIAPIKIYPGEDELQALAEGVFRVLDGEESARRMGQISDQGAEGLVL